MRPSARRPAASPGLALNQWQSHDVAPAVHQKIEDPRFLYWCDRLGVLVWAEAANAYVFDDIAAERLTLEWLEAVRRDYNHPCIIAWVPLNESWGVPDLEHDPAQRAFVRSLYYLTKTMDPTRPVIGNDGWQHAVGDILSIHDYAMDAALLTERYGSREALRHCLENLRPGHFRLLTDGQSYTDEPVVLSEFGGLSIKPTEGATWFGYATTGDAAALLALYSELVTALLQSSALAGFCYTQLTDTEQETNGLLTAEREPKLDIETVRAVNTQPARSVPSEIMDEIHRRELLRRRAEAAKAQGE